MTLIPAGFQPLQEAEGYIGLSGPFFWRRDESGRYDYGFASNDRHGNPNGVLHGAAILTFIDTILGHAVVSATSRRCATIALTSQFVAAVPTGGWVSGRADIRRMTKSLAFLDAEASADDTLLLTATAIFRVFDGSAR
ncbi:MAG: PaaI family thioesterase [Alphaproteobacteria bacterium]|nr:PaaI family thioesterase [Alphaproteobacteria bacterium]